MLFCETDESDKNKKDIIFSSTLTSSTTRLSLVQE